MNKTIHYKCLLIISHFFRCLLFYNSFSGWLSEVTGSYDLSWIVMGISAFAGALIIGLEIIKTIMHYLSKLLKKYFTEGSFRKLE